MHEVGITERLLAVALEHATGAGAGRVTTLHVRLGRDGDISPEALRFYWPLVSAGTPAQGARLRIRRVAGDALRLRSIDVEGPSGGGQAAAGQAPNNGSIGTGTAGGPGHNLPPVSGGARPPDLGSGRHRSV